MRLLIVGLARSPHIANYLELLTDTGWDLHLFHASAFGGTDAAPDHPALTVYPWPAPESRHRTLEQRAAYLAEVIDEIKPDIVHSHELQHAATLVYLARASRGVMAPWLVTNWGSDISWFGRDHEQAKLIRAILGACDYYNTECHRDVLLARAFGLRGRVVGVWPIAGGIDLEQADAWRSPGPTSRRKAIAVKGTISAITQAQHAMTAIERCAELIAGWEVCGYSVTPECEARMRALEQAGQIRYTHVSSVWEASRQEMLAMHGRARVSLALNVSDAMSTSFLEAIAMGSFPVQSDSSCGNEIIGHGRSGLFVPATDPDAVTAALRRALTDDALVDNAAEINRRVASAHLNRRQIKARVIDAYERITLEGALSA